MGKLNIAHHKSYHPYRRDNIEKVRQDEEEARLKEAKEEGRMMLADSEARIDRLRERAGTNSNQSSKKKGKEREKEITTGGTAQPAALPTTAGHINFFEDLEHTAISSAILTTKKKTDPIETEKGFPLAPSAKDLKPWYSERITDKDKDGEVIDEKRKRDLARQSMHDPLTSITHQLALASRSSASTLPTTNKYRPRLPPTPTPTQPPETHARLTRELSERERALELIRRKRREMGGRGSETPGGTDRDRESGYGDVFNRREVEEAHRGRERRRDRERDRGWGGGDNDRGRRDGERGDRRW